MIPTRIYNLGNLDFEQIPLWYLFSKKTISYVLILLFYIVRSTK